MYPRTSRARLTLTVLWLTLPILVKPFSLPNIQLLNTPSSPTSPVLPSTLLHAGTIGTPTCFPVVDFLALSPEANITNTTNSNPLTSYPSDCLDAMKSLLKWPAISHITYTWARIPKTSVVPPGYAPLPLTIKKASCVLQLDALEDSRAEDTFALWTLKESVLGLFAKCVRREMRGGFVPVGPKQVIAVTLRPSEDGEGGGGGGAVELKWNGTGRVDVLR